MVLKKLRAALEWTELPDRQPGAAEIRVKVAACGVCRTDLHVVDGELPDPKLPIIPGHENGQPNDLQGANPRRWSALHSAWCGDGSRANCNTFGFYSAHNEGVQLP